MQCLTCNELMGSIGHGMHHCGRCGSLKLPDGTPGDFVVPAAVIGGLGCQTLTVAELTERLYAVRSERDRLMWAIYSLARTPIMAHVEMMLPPQRDALRAVLEIAKDFEVEAARVRCFREGEDANDHNRRVYRSQRGVMKGNPHEMGSEQWKAWRDGYAYRDMVNDG